jgi:type III pantothenate kinase
MNLCIDIGNSRTKLALFTGDTLLERLRWTDWTLEDLLQLATNHQVQNVILCSVGRRLSAAEAKRLESQCRLIQLEADTPLPIQVAYQTPQTLGKDRIAAVVGALALFPAENCLVIDAGSCITYEFLQATGVYLGGNIAPGVNMRLRAMHEFTARLPQVDLQAVEQWIGSSTAKAMNNGALLGVVLEIVGYAQKWAAERGNIRSILTGGDAPRLLEALPIKVAHEPDLVLIGLNKILKHNVA